METNNPETPAITPEIPVSTAESTTPPTAPTVLQPHAGLILPTSVWPARPASAPPQKNILDEALRSARQGDPGALARYLVLRRQPVAAPIKK